MTIGILPNVSFFKSELVCKFGNKSTFPHKKVEEQPNKTPKKGADKSTVAFVERFTTVGLRIAGHKAAGIFIDFTEGYKSLGTNSTSTIHQSYATSSKYPGKQRSVAE